MQETRYNDELMQKIYSGKTREEVESAMDAALRPGEQLIRRENLSLPRSTASTGTSAGRMPRSSAVSTAIADVQDLLEKGTR